MTFRLTAIASLLAVLSGCAAPMLTPEQAREKAVERTNSSIAQFDAEGRNRAQGVVREIATPLNDFKRTEKPRVRGDVNVRAAAAPFGPILSEIARNAGYSVAFADSVDVNRKVTLDLNRAVADDAIRTTAFLAGYVAVIDKQRQTVMISDTATYTFRLPASVFSTLAAQYNVGGNPANAAASSSQGGGSGTSLRAEFTVSGREGTNAEGLTQFLNDIAGGNANVQVNSTTGHISVRANAQALKRVHEFLRGFSRDAMTQVEIEASVVEVALTNDFALGIQWGKVLDRSGYMFGNIGGMTGSALQAVAGRNPADMANATANENGLGAMRVGASSTSIIKALASFTDVHVVSQPRLFSLNNVPATFFDGTQMPYLGSVEQTASSDGGEPTVTGTVAFAIDGVSFSAVPSVIDEKNVQITLVPVLSNVTGWGEFLNGQLRAPQQANKQTFMRVMAENGKTLILGGIRHSKDSKETHIPSSTGKSSTTKEIVILLRANVIPAPDFDPIVNESL